MTTPEFEQSLRLKQAPQEQVRLDLEVLPVEQVLLKPELGLQQVLWRPDLEELPVLKEIRDLLH